MSWGDILAAILSLIAGGSITALFVLPATKQKARAEAIQNVQDVYQELIDDLRKDKQYMKVEIKELQEWKIEAMNILKQNTKDISELKKNECVIVNCSKRTKKKFVKDI